MTTQISNKIQLDKWMVEMIHVEEHLRKISLSYHNYFIRCSSCGWEVSYSDASKHFIIDNNMSCHHCKEGIIRLKSTNM